MREKMKFRCKIKNNNQFVNFENTSNTQNNVILTKQETGKGLVQEVFRERSFESMRAYFEYIARGKFTIEYTMRLNNEGAFNLPQTRVEALYQPEMFGEFPNAKMVVHPQ